MDEPVKNIIKNWLDDAHVNLLDSKFEDEIKKIIWCILEPHFKRFYYDCLEKLNDKKIK